MKIMSFEPMTFLVGFLLETRSIHSGGTLRTNRIPVTLIPNDWCYSRPTKADPIPHGSAKCKKLGTGVFIVARYNKHSVNLISIISPVLETVERVEKDKNMGVTKNLTSHHTTGATFVARSGLVESFSTFCFAR
jgi:hypothetical protein